MTLLLLSTDEILDMVAVITGHCLIGRNTQTLMVLSPKFCRSSVNKESIEYFICSLPAHALPRMVSLGSVFFRYLSNLSGADISHLLNFVRSSNWSNGVF